MNGADALDRLCAAAGIERVYHDQFGQRHEVAPDTIHAIAAVLGVGAGDATPPLVEAATVVVAGEGRAAVSLAVPAGRDEETIAWELVAESGHRRAGTATIGAMEPAGRMQDGRHERRRLPLPRGVSIGYHRLRVSLGDARGETELIVAPRTAYMPPALAEERGVWGIAAQLYSLRSERDWGMGDFGSLTLFIRGAAACGADAVGVNPLHALMLDEPDRASPYSPSSRTYLNPLYVEIEAVPDFWESAEARALVAAPDFAAGLERLRAEPLIDYAGVAAAKLRALRLLHESFRKRHATAGTPRAREFAAFLEREGESLRRFCIFQALRETRGAADSAQRDWRNWPRAFADPGSDEVAVFAAANAARIEFFGYCQWVARLQLSACAAAARDAGMRVGLYGDLAVGVDAAAGEAWAMQDVIVPGWSIGAPPDAWNRRGQDWGLSPLSPTALRRSAYRPFVALLRHNMREVGALRIDHILGLWRSFWIRHGQSAAEGAYVRSPFADLVAIIAIESQRARCIVVGEDLGTVPPGLREALHEAGILSYRLLYFEHRPDGRRASAGDYPRLSLVAIGTHDLPPLAAFWSGADIATRRALGQFHSDDEADAERRRRAREREELAALWRQEGIDVGGEAAPVEAAYRFLARSPGRIVMVQIEDALGLADQVNVPGTIDEHPNWRRRLPIPVERLFEEQRVRALCAAMREERPRSSGASP